jgi:hypothetical protein
MAGFGTAPMGTSGAGLGVPVAAADPPDGPAGARFINPASGDYEQDSDTRQLKQMPIERQQVMLALRTILGSSSALPTFGVKAPRKMGDTFAAEMTAAVKVALHHLTDVQKVISIDSITVERGTGGRSRTTVKYTITSSGLDDELTV